MEEFLIKLLNKLISKNIPAINKKVDAEIKDHNLDPLKHVTAGSVNLGTIHLGIANPTVNADYSIDNLTGLSSVAVDSIVISTHKPEGNLQGVLTENFVLAAHFSKGICTEYAAKVTAKAGFLSESEKVHGLVLFGDVTLHATGSVTVTLDAVNGEVCVKETHIETMSMAYGSVKVEIEGLGVFSPFKNIIVSKMTDFINKEVKQLGSQSVRNMLNKAIAKVDFPCAKLPETF